MTSKPTVPADLEALLETFVGRVRARLESAFVGAYLIGSFAVGDADAYSDVDFVIATAHDIPDADLGALQAMHGEIHDLDNRWARRLDGSYVPTAILRRRDPTGTRLLYLDNGRRSLVRSRHCNRLVTRWMVRERGRVLAGPARRDLVDAIDPDDLRSEAADVMREWAEEIRADPGAMDNRWYQPYAVVSYCRMLYTLQTGEITSKPRAAHWARETLDPQWRALIQRAQAQRAAAAAATAKRARTPADPDDLAQTHAFIEAALTTL